MRIIKPYGRSVVEKANDAREIIPTSKEKGKAEKAESISTLMSKPELVLAQWIGMLDKIIQKPGAPKSEEARSSKPKDIEAAEKRKSLNALALELRQILGKAIWQKLTDKANPLIHFASPEQVGKFETLDFSDIKLWAGYARVPQCIKDKILLSIGDSAAPSLYIIAMETAGHNKGIYGMLGDE